VSYLSAAFRKAGFLPYAASIAILTQIGTG
jgi:hypothetical protein